MHTHIFWISRRQTRFIITLRIYYIVQWAATPTTILYRFYSKYNTMRTNNLFCVYGVIFRIFAALSESVRYAQQYRVTHAPPHPRRVYDARSLSLSQRVFPATFPMFIRTESVIKQCVSERYGRKNYENKIRFRRVSLQWTLLIIYLQYFNKKKHIGNNSMDNLIFTIMYSALNCNMIIINIK